MFTTIEQIITKNTSMGHHFFDRETMRFFNSRYGSTIVVLRDIGTCFVTSEKFNEKAQRRYTLRLAKWTGDIMTVGKFQQFDTARAALSFAVNLQREINNGATFDYALFEAPK